MKKKEPKWALAHPTENQFGMWPVRCITNKRWFSINGIIMELCYYLEDVLINTSPIERLHIVTLYNISNTNKKKILGNKKLTLAYFMPNKKWYVLPYYKDFKNKVEFPGTIYEYTQDITYIMVPAQKDLPNIHPGQIVDNYETA